MASQYVSNNVKTGLDRMLVDDIIGDVTITNDAAANILTMMGLEYPAATDVFDIIRNQVTASQAASNNVKTSRVPVGLDRMLVDDIIGGVTIRNDASNILTMLGVEHPATDVFDITRNQVTASQASSNNVKTSRVPVGLDRMLVDDITGVTITIDPATILRMLGVEYPAATDVQKLLGDIGGDLTITHEGATILKTMESVQHPAAKNKQQRRRGKVYKNWKLKSRRRYT